MARRTLVSDDPQTDTYAEAAGDPGDAANLPATTGRDPEAGTPDVEVTE